MEGAGPISAPVPTLTRTVGYRTFVASNAPTTGPVSRTTTQAPIHTTISAATRAMPAKDARS
eukprot:9413439-Prorocentrum_lima.AAC.1